MAIVSVVKGKDRAGNIKSAVGLAENEIEAAIKNKKSNQLFIKINAIDTNFPAACTHIDALTAVLELFYGKFDEIVVGDNSFVFTKNKGGPYRSVLDKFPKVRISDLTEFESEEICFKGLKGTATGRMSLLPRKAFTISLALPKTHDTFVYTGCLKNMFGCVIRNRAALHAMGAYDRILINRYVKGNSLKWQNMIDVINRLRPDLCILDGYEGMEGDGPIFGSKVQLGVAMCSLDGLALDRLAAEICGMGYVPYMSMLPANKDIDVVKKGFEDIGNISRQFKPHYNAKYQLMDGASPMLPMLDVRLSISILRRSYRIKDKIMERLRRP